MERLQLRRRIVKSVIKIDIYTDNVNSVQRVYLSRLMKDFLIGRKLNFQPTQQLTLLSRTLGE